MPKRVLAIGLGGSGKASLTILKERLKETYGQVPDSVVLLSLDTDSLREVDRFAGTRLNPAFGMRNRLPEYQQIVSPGGTTMDTMFADIRSGKTAAFMSWLEHEKLDRMLGPTERDIRGGTQQRRPIGRTALFLRYANPVYQSVVEAIGRMYGEFDEGLPGNRAEAEKAMRQIFLISSVAGGTGSGMLIDVANLVRHAINHDQNWLAVTVSAVVVLPDPFASYTPFMDDPTNLKPNSFAALRELDRFMRVHSNYLPYMIRYAEGEQSITWSTNQPVDHVYLVDTAGRSASQDTDLGGDPMKGVFPVIADFLMAHIDNSLGDALATLRSNAGMHYDKATGRMYSGFSVMNYIFPVDDVIESFSYRFLRELLAREFLPLADDKRRAPLEQEAADEIERDFTAGMVAGRTNPAIIQKAIVATKQINPETPDMSWSGLFGLIGLPDTGFAENYQSLQQSLDYLQGNLLLLTKDGDRRREDFDEDANRLLNAYAQFQDDYLGPQIDPDDPESRAGGQWDVILGQYREALRLRFGEVLDAVLLAALNRRNDAKIILPNRLPYARAMAQALKNYLMRFRASLTQQWAGQQVDPMLRQVGEEVRNAITWMNDSRGKPYFPPFSTEPRRTQESSRAPAVERMRLALHHRVYRAVFDVLDTLGAAEKDSTGQRSVLDTALLELESWERTLADVDRTIGDWNRQHESNRADKRTVKVRRYLTNLQFENELYDRPDHAPAVATRIMGQVGDQKGLQWERQRGELALDWKLVSIWGEESKGAGQIARTWFTGAKQQFQVVRNNVTVAERLAAEFPSHSSFVNRCLQVTEPFLHYNPAKNHLPPYPERYVSFNLEKAREDAARKFLEQTQRVLRDQRVNVDAAAESLVACTVVEVARGIKLTAVEVYSQCEPEYRAKLAKGRESIHLFPEEQNAINIEQSITTLGETANLQRALHPELVAAMGDYNKLRGFTLAAAYGLIYADAFEDPETGQESTELYVKLNGNRQLPLSQSRVVRELDASFTNLTAAEQMARLYLNALQNFMIKVTERPGFNPSLIEIVKGDLLRRGVSLAGIERPFTLPLRDVGAAITDTAAALGPTSDDVPNAERRRIQNAERRRNRLDEFVRGRLNTFKISTDPRIYDMGTVMQLILREEINRLRDLTQFTRRSGQTPQLSGRLESLAPASAPAVVPTPVTTSKGGSNPVAAPKPILNTGKAWAVLVGVNHYENQPHIPSLHVCVDDVTAVQASLAGKYTAVRLLTDATLESSPTRVNILNELSSVAQTADEGDLLLFYFSGHGIAEAGESYLLPRDARLAALPYTSVAMAEVRKIINASLARAKVIVLDACHSGAAIGKAGPAMTPEFIKRVFTQAEGIAVLASCKQGQQSWEWPEEGRSVFTHFLLEALSGKADFDGKRFVTVSDASRYVTDGVKAWAVDHGVPQTPTLQYAVAGDIVLLKV